MTNDRFVDNGFVTYKAGSPIPPKPKSLAGVVFPWEKEQHLHAGGGHNQKSHAGGGGGSPFIAFDDLPMDLSARSDQEAALETFFDYTVNLEDSELGGKMYDARNYYTGEGYMDVNGPLRDLPDGGSLDDLGTRARLTTEGLDASFDQADRFNGTFRTDGIVYRGVEGVQFQTGDQFYDKAFVSTTIDPSITKDFLGTPASGGGTLLQIKVPAGTKFVPGLDSELEMIFNRGSAFKIVETFETTINGNTVAGAIAEMMFE